MADLPNLDAFNKVIHGTFTKAAKLEWLSRYTGQPVEAIQHLLDVKGKKGFKLLGKRFGSNINSLAGYLHEVAKENQFKKPGRLKKPIRSPSDITPFNKQLNIKIHPNTLNTLHRLATVHEIPTKVIDNALKAGAPLKTLLKMLNSESIDSDVIHKHLIDKTKEKMAVKGAANTIKPVSKVPLEDLEAKNAQIRGEIKDNLKKLNKESNKVRILDRKNYLSKTLEHGANEFPDQNLTNPSGTNRLRKMSTREWIKKADAPSATTSVLRGPLTTNHMANIARLMIGASKTVKNLAVGYALNAASDAYVAPHVRKAGEKLGEHVLGPLGEQIDNVLPGINSEHERQRKQLMIQTHKDENQSNIEDMKIKSNTRKRRRNRS